MPIEMNRSKSPILLTIGCVALALSGILRFVFAHNGASSGTLDFVTGFTGGVAIGFLLLALLIKMRERRGPSDRPAAG